MKVLEADFVTSSTEKAAGAGWPDDGTPEIAFAGRWPGSDRTYLFTILSDGSGRVKVTDRLASEPAWSS